jgi:Spy/CpxP family protein refolding chaperone
MNRIPVIIFGAFLSVLCVIAPALAADVDDAPPYGPGYGWMGPGMMGGSGMGPGMMGGYGMGPYAMLNLSDDQRGKINKIHDAERKQHWTIMGKMMDVENKQRDLLAQSEPDPKKVGAAYAEMAKLRQQMLETHVQASNDMQKVLTKEQREQLQQWRRGMHGGPRGMMGR